MPVKTLSMYMVTHIAHGWVCTWDCRVPDSVVVEVGRPQGEQRTLCSGSCRLLISANTQVTDLVGLVWFVLLNDTWSQ